MFGFFAGVLIGWVTMVLWVWFAGRQFPATPESNSYAAGYANGFEDALAEVRAKRSAAGKKAAQTRLVKGVVSGL